VIAFPNDAGGLAERDPSKLDLEHSKADIALVRGLAKRGLLSPEQMAAMVLRLENVAINGEEERIRVAADKALASLTVQLMRIVVDSAKGSGDQSASVTNQQINIYLPANGREVTNGSNGQH
jgi:hypothetical protein